MPAGQAAQVQASDQEADNWTSQNQQGAEEVHPWLVEGEEANDDKAHRSKRQQCRTGKAGNSPTARKHGSGNADHSSEQKQSGHDECRVHVPSRLTESETADGLGYRVNMARSTSWRRY